MLLELFFNSQMNGLFQYNFCKCLSKEARLEMGDVKCRCAGLDSVRVAGKGKKTPIAWCGGCRRSRKARMKNGRRPGESRMKIVIRDSQRFSNSKPFETNKIIFRSVLPKARCGILDVNTLQKNVKPLTFL